LVWIICLPEAHVGAPATAGIDKSQEGPTLNNLTLVGIQSQVPTGSKSPMEGYLHITLQLPRSIIHVWI
jgi:hypothetical protein